MPPATIPGGRSYSRGALYDILQNRLYLGEIHHKGLNHPGEHASIVALELWDGVQAQLKSDHQGRRNGVKANSPSLLVGVLQDPNGKRLTPAHASKNGKRYRYYVCPASSVAGEPANKAIRLPAHDVERQVAGRLHSFLRSGKSLMDELSQAGDSPALLQQIVAAAAKQSDKLRADLSTASHALMTRVMSRVVVHPDRMEIEVDKQELRSALVGGPQPPTRHGTPQPKPGCADVIRLAIDVSLKRCGGEMRLVLPSDHGEQDPSHPASSLLRALVRAQIWREWILAGEASGRRSIAQRVGLDERYVGRVLECAFLAPDIVQAILDGRQPTDLTFAKLTRSLPMSWIEQRMQLGFPSLRVSK